MNNVGDWKTTNDFPNRQRPVFYELIALENAMEECISEYKNKCGKAYVGYVREIKPMITIITFMVELCSKRKRVVHTSINFYAQRIKTMVGWHLGTGWKGI